MQNTRHPQSERFHALLTEIGTLHDRKQADYGNADDPFYNVRASVEWGVPGWIGALVRLTDKVRRLMTFARTRKLYNEGVIDSLLDIAVYALIAIILFQDWVSEETERNQIAEIRPQPIDIIPGRCVR